MTREKHKISSVLFSNSADDVYDMHSENSKCIFLLNLSELLLFLAQPPVCGQNWVFLKEQSPVSEELEGKVFKILLQQAVKSISVTFNTQIYKNTWFIIHQEVSNSYQFLFAGFLLFISWVVFLKVFSSAF